MVKQESNMTPDFFVQGAGVGFSIFFCQKIPNQSVKMLILAFINQNLSMQQKLNRK